MQQQLLPGALLRMGTYKIERVLGQGSFGITYLATHTSLGRTVAIKEFFMKELNSRGEDGTVTGLTDGSLSYNYSQKFKKEAQNLAQLEHPNIVRVTDCFDENGTFYYVMDYVDGENLSAYLKHGSFTKDESVSIITDVAKALQYMHDEKHMLHLDMKPGNVMRRSSDGHIFLIDFGLSKHFSENGEPETSTTIGLGTAGYAPIEQSNKTKSGEFRPTIDVYALGATLYKLLTTETPPAAAELVTDEDILDKSLQLHGADAHLIEVVKHAMQPSVKKRTQTISEFIKELTATPQPQPTPSAAQQEAEEETQFMRPEQAAASTAAQNSTASNAAPNQEQPQSAATASAQQPNDNTPEPFMQQPSKTNKTLIGCLIAAGVGAFVFIIICIVILFSIGRCSKSADYEDSIDVDTVAMIDTTAVVEDGYHEYEEPDGSIYKGYFKDGLYSGEGSYVSGDGTYTYDGNWANGKQNGYGTATWPKEDRDGYMCKYEGNFVDGTMSGKGKAYYTDHTYYEGTFKDAECTEVTSNGSW